MTDVVPLMSVSDVAARLGVPKATVYQWSSQGSGPRSFRVGGYLRFRPEDVDAWLEEHASRPATGGAA